MSEIKNVWNFLSEIFKDLIFLSKYFSKLISSFLDENILTYSLFSNSDFARSSIKGDSNRNSLKRGAEKLQLFSIAAANQNKSARGKNKVNLENLLS